ncbi:MAG: FAD-dependent thymidylate synthase [Brevundimonas sp.]
MTTSAQVIADSINVEGRRLTTLKLRYPRFIHAEFMTHRVFSRNASSSRAIPVARLIQDVIDDPAIPCYWGANQAGMQAGEEINEPVSLVGFKEVSRPSGSYIEPSEVYVSREAAWLEARDYSVEIARAFAAAGYHKQVVNRLLEPFAHINVVVTATEWSNFFDLRLHPDAEPNIQLLARAMKLAMDASRPKLLTHNEWHLPFVEEQGRLADLKMVSVARCARVSYETHDGEPTVFEKDLALGQRLASSGHWSPFEHQASPTTGRVANFRGWRSYRSEMGR